MRRNRFIKPLVCIVLVLLLVFLVIDRAGNDIPEPDEETAEQPSAEPVQETEFRPTVAPATPEPTPDLPEIDRKSWEYILINDLDLSNHLKSTYVPETELVENGIELSSRTAEYFRQFLADARAEGFEVELQTGYRSYTAQEYIFNGRASGIFDSQKGISYEDAVEQARKAVAYPGSSEHQLGMSADIIDSNYGEFDTGMAVSPAMQWMTEHCAEYGLILRYPENKTEVTGRSFEPWHFRYVGHEAAEYIMENGLCLEEFLALYD